MASEQGRLSKVASALIEATLGIAVIVGIFAYIALPLGLLAAIWIAISALFANDIHRLLVYGAAVLGVVWLMAFATCWVQKMREL